ncbi:bifunctional serine/threonine protein kinase/MFS transporter [Streptomyces sp. NPDC013171]|uniref:bifunctional serine/threonine protein kinase/MFS transporter n=1 Tax=Streptomyces sp. NPDC013171 TaxID=3364863 RepID=UPI0036C06247
MESLTVEDPTYIGPYRLIARLGAGGMGLVYLGRSEVGRTVAVKVVQPEFAAHPEFRRRFAREVAAARRVGGKWTADVLDADTDATVTMPWVATQYIAGPDLTSVVARDFGPLPEHSVRVLANRLSLALGAVHEAGLIHRDLKPSNVLVTVDGPRVIDFGIARAMESLTGDSLHTRTGILIGSPGFMSPEQVRGLALTPASDVFCLGAVLVYAATGRLLFGATDTGLNAHLFRIAEEKPDLTGVPESLLGLVRACLQKDPTERPTPAQITALTDGDGGTGLWLPGEVLAQLGRHAAQLLDYVPVARAEQPAVTPVAPPAVMPATETASPGAPPYGPPPTYVATAPATGAVADVPSPRRRWKLAVISLAQLAVLLAATDPGFLHTRRMTLDLVASFLVPMAALLLLGGHVVDRVGGKRTLVTGLVGFAVASVPAALLAGHASGPLLLVRAVQGGFGALVTSAALALVSTGFIPPRERIRAFGVYTTTSVGGPVLGLLITGEAAWGVLLFIAALLALAALAGTRVLPPDRPDRTGTPFDLPGVLLSTLAITGLVFAPLRAGTSRGESSAQTWGDPLVVTPLAGGVVLLLAFLWWQNSAPHPLLPPYVLKDRGRIGAFLITLLAGAAILSMTPLMASTLASGYGFARIKAWLVMLSMIAAVAVSATQIAPRLLRRGAAPRLLIVTGLVTTPLAVIMTIVILGTGGGYAGLIPFMFLAGLGMGLVITPVLATATAAVLPQHTGAASAAVIATQLVGTGTGAAVVMTMHTPPWWALGCLLLAALTAGLTVATRRPAPQHG